MDTKQIALPAWLQRANQVSYAVGFSGLALWIVGLLFPQLTTLSSVGNYMLSAGLVGIFVFVILLSNKHRNDALLASLLHSPCPAWLQPALWLCYGVTALVFFADIIRVFFADYAPALWAEIIFLIGMGGMWMLEKEKRYHLLQAHRALHAEQP